MEWIFRDGGRNRYVSVDLDNPHATLRMDITQLDFPDESFDFIYCSHVLEHVEDDRKAMCEFARVLRPDGYALFRIPITVDVTLEDWSARTPKARRAIFGQADHVRRCGTDYNHRFEEEGFIVTPVLGRHIVSASRGREMGIVADEEMLFCTVAGNASQKRVESIVGQGAKKTRPSSTNPVR